MILVSDDVLQGHLHIELRVWQRARVQRDSRRQPSVRSVSQYFFNLITELTCLGRRLGGACVLRHFDGLLCCWLACHSRTAARARRC